jgi:hypothetical protein
VPFWAKDIKVGFSNINAKAEGIEGKPAFREAFQRRRCLVPVDSFYEWAKTATGKQPYAIALADRGADGPGRPLGDVALSGGREGAQLCDHHDDTERDVRAAASPDASDPRAWGVAGLAGGGAGGFVPPESPALALSLLGDDLLAGKRAGR